jgi:hypothetical protein
MVETWKKLAFEDDVLLKSTFDANSVVMATDDNTPIVLVVAEQELVGRLTGGAIDGIALGIADNNIVQIDQADAADNEVAHFTANGLESLSYAELLAALSGDAGAAFDWNGQQITNFVIQIVADNTAKTALTAVPGNLVWQTDVAALYFCTVGE